MAIGPSIDHVLAGNTYEAFIASSIQIDSSDDDCFVVT
jgi:hypothetical protein